MTSCGASRDRRQCQVQPSLASGETEAQRGQPSALRPRLARSPNLRLPEQGSLPGGRCRGRLKSLPPRMQTQQSMMASGAAKQEWAQRACHRPPDLRSIVKDKRTAFPEPEGTRGRGEAEGGSRLPVPGLPPPTAHWGPPSLAEAPSLLRLSLPLPVSLLMASKRNGGGRSQGPQSLKKAALIRGLLESLVLASCLECPARPLLGLPLRRGIVDSPA